MRPLGTIRAIAVVMAATLLAAPLVAGTPESITVYNGTIYPSGALQAQGSLLVPASQPFVVKWTIDQVVDPILNASKTQVFVDEWRWTGPVPANGGETPEPPPSGVRTRQELHVLDPSIKVLDVGRQNEWAYSASTKSGTLLAENLQDCEIRSGMPRPVWFRGADTSTLPRVGFNGSVGAVVPGRTVLHVDCASGAVALAMPLVRQRELAVYDVKVQLSGRDERTGQVNIQQLHPGAFSTPNSSMPTLYDNLLRHVTFRPQGNDSANATFTMPMAKRVQMQTAVMQTEGSLVIPPFKGNLSVNRSPISNPDELTRLEGTFILLAHGRQHGLDGIEVAGSSREEPGGPVAAPRPTRPHVEVVGLAVAVGAVAIAFALVLGEKARLFALSALGLFSRFNANTALDHDLRRSIHQYIQRNPGARVHQAAVGMAIKRATLLHHLRILEKQGLIEIVRDGRKLYLFAKPLDLPIDARMFAYLRRPLVQQIMRVLVRDDVLTQEAIAREAGVRQSYVSQVINRLDAAGVIKRQRLANGCKYELTPVAAGLLG